MLVPPGSQYTEPPPPIFISYRRSDSLAYASHLCCDLTQHFGERAVFMDTSSIELGSLWRLDVRNAALACRVMLVVIGKQWLTVTDASTGRRRLDDPHDVLRAEVALALARGIRVVPVLVDGASLPKKDDLPDDLQPLLDRQAYRITAEQWHHDVSALIGPLEGEVGPLLQKTAQPGASRGSYTTAAASAATIMFSVNPETRDVLIAFAKAAAIIALIAALALAAYMVYRHFESRRA